jgi:hypothetical protein
VAIQDQPNGEAGLPPAPELLQAALPPKGAARRRFASAGASGVLLTLASTPGMAASLCATPSGSLSGGLSSPHGTPAVCAGKSPDFWRANPAAWPSNLPTATKYGPILRTCNGTSYQNIAFMKLLSQQSFDNCNIGMYVAATYLNIVTHRINVLTVQDLQNIWFSYRTKGYYAPSAGVQWDATKIVQYLKGTMDLIKT